MTAVSAHDIAAELRRRLPGLGSKKLHKLLYYCQGHHLAAFGTPLFPQPISAWDMGPVVGNLWYEEKETGPAPTGVAVGEAELNTIGYVISRYGSLTGADLERLTHSEPPWQEANQRRTPNTSAKITLESIERYFRHAPTGDDDADLPDVDTVSRWLAGAAERLAEPGKPDSAESLLARLGHSPA